MRRRTAVVAILIGGVAFTSCGGDDRTQAQLVREGREMFQSTCAACHGPDLRGTTSGPSFLNPIYLPDHHPDEAFYTAVKDGVQPHHWNFGAMPAQPGFDDADIRAIIEYIRSEQRDAGVEADPSPTPK
jgi:mono/diheme cytochrome c family protein